MRAVADVSHRYPKLAFAGLLAVLLVAGCSTPKPSGSTRIASLPPAPPPVMSSSGAPYSVDYSANLQCVPYARLRSGIGIFGDAYTWWDTAAGRYARGKAPVAGSVLVLRKTNRLSYGHVAVVTQQVNPREIKIDHANWQRGTVITGMPVLDVSPGNDWTELRFWNQEAQVWGAIYPAEGFIYNAPAGAQTEPSDFGTTIISSEGQRYWAPQQPLP
jgi:surface antigen